MQLPQLVVDGKFHFGSVTALYEEELAEKLVSRSIKFFNLGFLVASSVSIGPREGLFYGCGSWKVGVKGFPGV